MLYASFLSGVSLGRLCVYHQPRTPSRVCAAYNGSVLQPTAGLLHDLLHNGTFDVNASKLHVVYK